MGLARYLKTAFTNRWNLLALFGGVGFALLSGRPDVVLPLVLAAEAAYVGLLGSHPKFQKYVDAQEAKARRAQRSESNEQAVRRMLRSLPRESHQRFEQLRERCLELREIASDLKRPGARMAAPLDSLQLEGLDRLLWIYLRLLFTRYSLSRFLERTRVETIRGDIERLEKRLAATGEDESPHARKIRHTLQDNLATSRNRLENYAKAESNYEYVELEIDRLENKIKSLAEVAINRQEPDYISSQVDQVATSMLETERTMNELDFATGLGHLDDQAPELLQPQVKVAQ